MTTGNNKKRKSIKLDARTKIFVIGALLAGAIFLIEAGIAEIMIAMDEQCRASIATLRLTPDVFEVCAPEWQWYLVRATSRGIAWVVNRESAPIIGWLSMGFVYSLFGGASAQIFRGRGIIAFLLLQAGMIAALMGLGYFRQFIV
ncbi:MAG: hypothetical protein PVH60_13075 [Anaerolineales bacterium]